MVVHGSGRTLDGCMRVQIEIVLEWVGDAGLDQGARKRVLVAVTLILLREESHVMTLASDDHDERHVERWIGALNQSLHVVDLLLDHVQVLAFADTVTEVDDTAWKLATADLRDPCLQHRLQHRVDVVRRDHLHAETIRLARRSVSVKESVTERIP